MRIFFMGATRFGYRCLNTVLKSGAHVVGCASTPEIFQISYAPSGVKNVNYVDFSVVARELGIPSIPYDRGAQSRFVERVALLKPDLIVVAGWYYMVSGDLRRIAPKGAIGLHGSLLPKYRGGAPLVWSMINGEEEGGVSLFYLEDGVDEGDIIAQKPFPIEETDTIADALRKLEDAGARLLEENLPLLANGIATRIAQNHAEATLFPQRSPADGEIDWSWSAKRIRDFIRAQTRPYPGAFTKIGRKKVILWDADIVDEGEV
jgi:methionyl-tRNA formyltransferase